MNKVKYWESMARILDIGVAGFHIEIRFGWKERRG